MEHRHSKRLPLSLKVLLHHNNVPVTVCKTRDVAKDGVFVITGPLVYRNNTLLKIEFEINTEDGKRWYYIPAMVRHNTGNGIGLFFQEDNSAAKIAWRDMLARVDAKKLGARNVHQIAGRQSDVAAFQPMAKTGHG